MRRLLFFVSLLIVGISGFQIDCEFGMKTYVIGEVYTCKTRRMTVVRENDVVDSIVGSHLTGWADADVKVFHVDDQICKYIPLDIENFFPNLEGLKIVSSGLRALTQDNLKWLPDLRFCDFSDNKIEILNDDLFQFNSRLTHVSFDSNKISMIGTNVFASLNEIEMISLKNNECIDEEIKTPEEIRSASERFLEKCSAEPAENPKSSESDFSDKETASVTKISTSKAINDESLKVSCELSDVYWKYSRINLFTCSILTHPVNQLGYHIKLFKPFGERVEGLSFNNNKQVKFLPENIAAVFPNLIELSVEDSYIETISGNIFADLQKLRRLSLSNNDLHVIENATFAGLTNLEELDLSEGNIRFIEEGAFSGLASLKALNLGGNKISFIQAKTFEGLTELCNISIEWNHLVGIEESLFSRNTQLVNVWLNANKISILSPHVFEGLNSLGYVDLQGNECIDGVYDPSSFDEMKAKLTENCKAQDIEEEYGNIRNEYIVGAEEELVSIVQYADVEETNYEDYPTADYQTETAIMPNKPEDKQVFCDFGAFYWHFSQENFTTCTINKHQVVDAKGFTITEVKDGADVKGLYMGYNKNIKFLPDNISEVFPNLVELSAQNSGLVVLAQKNFAGLSHLKSLKLANNNIKYIDSDAFDDLNELEELDLSSNSLEYIDENLFLNLKNLKTLRLSDNKLHYIHLKLFRNLRDLQNVSISNNQLSTLDENLFKMNRNLKNVWLQNNKVKSLSPNMLNTAQDLEYVDLRENKCIDTVYETKAFELMKSEILKKCGDGYVLKHGKKTTVKSEKKSEKQKKKKNKKKEKNKPKPNEEEIKEVTCEYEDVFWPNLNKTLFTCTVSSDQIIDGPGYTISVNANPYALPLIDGLSVQALSFGHNKNIKFLPDNISEAFPNLVTMSAAHCSLENMSKITFGNLTELKSLDLGHNKIKAFEDGIFEDLTSLEELILDENKLEVIEETTFTNIRKLKKMRMAGNKLTKVDPNAFEVMTELVEVSIEFEEPSQANEDLFKTNKKLKILNINGKSLGTMDWNDPTVKNVTDKTSESTTADVSTERRHIDEAFAELSCKFRESFSVQANSTLYVCEIDGNELSSDSSAYNIKSSPQPQVSRVESVRLMNVKSFPDNLSQVFPELVEILASNSGLTRVTKKNFDGLGHLKYLDLSKNFIRHIESDAFDDLDDVEFLDLSENNMEFIEETLFYKLDNLKQLHLSWNQLHYIHKKLFKHLANLEVVTIDHNLLSVVEPFTFRQNQKLRIIDLSHNKMESLHPKIVDQLKDLESINLSGNKCISGEFDASKFDQMKEEIKKNCRTKSIDELADEDETWIDCDFDPSENSCTVSDHTIQSSNYRVRIRIKSGDDESLSKSNGEKVEHLIFVGSHIKYLPKSISESFPNLAMLSTADTLLNSISRENFMNLPKLKSLKINHVEMFEPDTFEDMASLENFNVESDVDEIDEATFSKLYKLKVFYYETKNTLIVDPKAFDGMTELVEFELNSQASNDDTTANIETTIQRNNPNLLKLKINDHFENAGETSSNSTERLGFIQTTQATTQTTHPSITNTPRIPERAVTCYLNYMDWSNTNTTLITCNLENQAIDDAETIIKLTPYSNHVEGLKIDNNKKVKFLPVNIARSFPNLVQLSVKNTSIETLSNDDFNDLKKLRTLDLSGNNIRSIESDTFANLEDLIELDLSNNQIDYVDKDSFTNLKKLKTLRLNGNKITFLHPKTFETLPELITLNLEGNNLPQNTQLTVKNSSNVTTDADDDETTSKESRERSTNKSIPCIFSDKFWFFDGTTFFSCELKDSINDPNVNIEPSSRNTRVRGLSFVYNKAIKFLPQNLAETLPNLVGITAFNSSLESISQENFRELRKVKFLNLAHNRIKRVPPGTFNDLSELEELDLSNNQIEELDESTFEKLSSLKTLYLAGNHLKLLPVNVLENLLNLRNISLESNKIVKIHPNLFKRNPKLENVWLNGNHIREIDSVSFDNLKNLEYVDLQGNVCIDKFFEGNKLDQLKFEINKNCKVTENLNNPVTYRPDTKPSISNGPKHKEIICDLRYIHWSDVDSDLYTCEVTDVDLISSEDTLKPTSYKVKALIINDKKSVNLPDNIAQTFPDLHRIEIKNSSLNSISQRAFKGLNLKLVMLDLSSNLIDSIHPETFADSPLLEGIILDNNRIKSIDNIVFPQSLKLLSFASNQISSLNAKVFKKLSKLSAINLEKNTLSELPEDLFQENQNLKEIILSGNRIKRMSAITFEILPKLETINLEENECISGFYDRLSMKALLAEITRNCQPTTTSNSQDEVDRVHLQPEFYDQLSNYDYEDNSQARVVDPLKDVVILKSKKLACLFEDAYSSAANKNFFTCKVESQPIESTGYTFDDNPDNRKVKSIIFMNNEETNFMPHLIGQTFPNLVELDFQNSSLKSVSPENFKSLKQLKYLDLSGNNLKVIAAETFDELSSLEQLIMTRSGLKFFDQTKLKSLKKLDLNENQLRFVDSTTFAKLPELVMLNLEGNQLTEIDDELFKFNTKLEIINLSHNKLKSIEPEFFTSKQLKTVDLRRNTCLNRIFFQDSVQEIKETVTIHCKPFDAVKKSLLVCKGEVESCQSNSDSKKLRTFLRKSEIKVTHLNRQQKKLTNAVNFEKNLVRKLQQKAVESEGENEKLRRNNSGCRSDELSVQLSCAFEETDDGFYVCRAENLNVGRGNTSIVEVQGDHKRGKRTADVTSLTIADQSLKSVPHGVAGFFVNLKQFTILNSGLTVINPFGFGRLYKLTDLTIKGNDIENIEHASFDDFPMLEHLDFSNNNIFDFPEKAFKKLSNLKLIDLSNNRIKSLSADFMPEGNQLKHLLFANNNLESIDLKLLPKFQKLRFVDLTGNNCIDGKLTSYDGKNTKDMMAFLGEIAMKCAGESYELCNAK